MKPELLSKEPSAEALGEAAMYVAAKKDFDDAKDTEGTRRTALLESVFGDYDKFVGSKTTSLGNVKVSFTFKQNVTVDKTGMDDMYANLVAHIQQGKLKSFPQPTDRNEAEAHAQKIWFDVFRFKPELIAAGYKALPDDIRDVVDAVLTTKPATPGVTIK